MRVEESIEIARPPKDVWALVVDPCNDPQWCHKVRTVEVVGDRRWSVVHKPVPLRPAIELRLEQVEAEPHARIRLREEDEAAVLEIEYLLEPTAAGTRFTQVSEFDWKKLPRVLHSTFRRGVERDVRGQLKALKGLLEG